MVLKLSNILLKKEVRMKLYLKYFKKFWLNFLITVVLVAAQVAVSLTIPKYMAKMINVGIQQKGIEQFVYSRLDEKNYQTLLLAATAPQQELLQQSYQKVDQYYQLKQSTPALEQLTIYSNKILMSSVVKDPTIQDILAKYQIQGFKDLASLSDADKESLQQALKQDRLDTQTKISQAHLIYRVNQENGMEDSSVAYVKKEGLEMLLVAISGLLFVILASFSAGVFSTKVAKDLRQQVFEKVESFSDQEFVSFSTASLITRTVGDTSKIQQFLGFVTRFIVLSPLTAIGAIIQSSSTSIDLIWILVVVVIAMVITIGVLVVKVTPSFILMQKLLDKISLAIRENLSGLRVIRAFNTQDIQTKRYNKTVDDFKVTFESMAKIMAFINPIMIFAMNGTAVLIVFFGAKVINSGSLDLGGLLAFIQFSSQVIFSFMLAGMLFFTVPQITASLKRIDEVIISENKIIEKENQKGNESGTVVFDHVSFSYDEDAQPAIEDLSFTLQKGQTIAFIGGTGSGKSTIGKLLLRLYDRSSGSIQVNGVAIQDYSLHDLRQQIAYVPQKSQLFSMTVAENIAYGQDMNIDKVKESAKIACANTFIEDKPEGYDYFIEEKGVNLSGGQKQRLQIARAIYKNSGILFFDDSFSALDYKTDAQLRKNLRQARKDASILIVAQRIPTIMHADKIIVLDGGKVVGEGTHQELLSSCKVYQEIAASQIQEETHENK